MDTYIGIVRFIIIALIIFSGWMIGSLIGDMVF